MRPPGGPVAAVPALEKCKEVDAKHRGFPPRREDLLGEHLPQEVEVADDDLVHLDQVEGEYVAVPKRKISSGFPLFSQIMISENIWQP